MKQTNVKMIIVNNDIVATKCLGALVKTNQVSPLTALNNKEDKLNKIHKNRPNK